MDAKTFSFKVVLPFLLPITYGWNLYAAPARPEPPVPPSDQLKLLDEIEEAGTERVVFDPKFREFAKAETLPGTGAPKTVPREAEAPKLPVSINGEVSGRFGASVHKPGKKNVISDDTGRLKLAVSRDEEKAGFYGAFSLYYIGRAQGHAVSQNFSRDAKDELAEIYDTDVDRVQFEMHQAYINFYTKHLDIRAGRQVIKWGASDAPTTTLNPNAMVSPGSGKNAFTGNIEDTIEPVNALKTNLYIGKFDIETVIVPMFQATEFAAPDSYWGTRFQRKLLVTKTKVPLEGVIDDAGSGDKLTVPRERIRVPFSRVALSNKKPGPALRNVAGGIAVKRQILQQDLSLYYFHGHEQAPLAVSKARINGNLDSGSRLFNVNRMKSSYVRLKYPNTDALGLAASGEIFKFGYRLDANYSLQREFLLDEFNGLRAVPVDVPGFDSAVYDGEWDVLVRQRTRFMDVLSYAAGIDYDITKTIKLWLDYSGRQLLDYKKKVIAGERQDFIAPRIQFSFLRQTFFVRSQAMVTIQTLDTILRPEVEYRFTQNAQAYLGVYVLLGEKRRARSAREFNLGPLVNKDMVYTMARYIF